MKKSYAIGGGIAFAALAAVLVSSTSLYTQIVPIPPENATPVTQTHDVATPEQAAKPAEVVQDPSVVADVQPPAHALTEEPTVIEPMPATPSVDGAQGERREDNLAAVLKSVDSTSKHEKKVKPEDRSKLAEDHDMSRMVAGASAPVPSAIGAPPAAMDQQAYQGYHDEGRDKFADIKTNPVKLVKDEPVSTFSTDVDTAAYAFVRGQINAGVLPQKDAVRIEELINYFDYDYALPETKAEPFKPSVYVYPSPWNKDTKIMQVGIKGYDVVTKEKSRANLVFLLDVSGSMEEPNKLPLLKNSLKLLVEQMQPTDTISIVVYAGAAGTVLEPTRGTDKAKILASLENLTAGGSTAGAEGIRQAYALAEQNFDKKAVNRVILATDGDFNVGITDTEELKGFVERKRDSGIFLSVLGFGQGNYNDEMMQVLAQNGNGNAAYIDSLSEARKVLVQEAGGTLFTIAGDVKIQVEFNPQQVSEYRLIGYETRILNQEDFNNDKVDAGDIGSGHEVTALYEVTPTGSAGKLIDDSRYAAPQQTAAAPANTGELAFVKVRYKLPGETESKLITRPVTSADDVKDAASVPNDLGFAAAVAGFGQLLRQDPYTKNFSYDDVVTLATSTKGKDEFGYRAEFLNLVRLAKSAAALEKTQ